VRQDELIARVAAELGERVVGPLGGGQFGAVRLEGDRVLKAFPHAAFEPAWARGARMCARLRAEGYPAPAYDGVGVADGAVWSIQELLPGEVPVEASPAHVAQMVELAARHRDVVPDERSVLCRHILDEMVTAVAKLAPLDVGLELAALLARSEDVELRTTDVTHYDFHTSNVLVIDDEITGVFDWDFARPGDWRCDLANIVVTTDHAVAGDALRENAPPDVAALLVGWHCARYLAFDVDVHPADVDRNAALVSERLGQWWRR